MLRRPLLLALAAALVTAGPAVAAGYTAPAGSGALFLFSGHGWGHGVGMSQYGAFGYAQHGATYDQILQHYYPGTTLGQAPVSTIRVLLAAGRKKLALASDAPFTVVDGTGALHALAAGKLVLDPGLALTVDGNTAPQTLSPPLTFVPAQDAPLTLGRPYRGQIVVDLVNGKLRAVDVVGLEQYLYGVVPAEMPSTWSPEALKAQAVAARSYALATRRLAAPFDVYGDTRSQVYRGIAAETAATNAAVDATAGQVVLYDGAVATTYFSSTSGGETESAADVWGGEAPPPYLVSVPDPYDTISPFHDWGPVPVTALAIARALKVPGRIMDATTTLNAAGRVADLDLLALPRAAPAPVATPVLGTVVRAKLKLRSTWFDVGVLSLLPPQPAAPVLYGTTVTLSGLVRGVDGVTVEARSSRSPWQAIGTVAPAADGSVQVTATPEITTDYRLATASAAAAYVRIRVMPVVKLTATSAASVAGTEQPVLPGAPVLVQQQDPAGAPAWTTVARGTTDASGAFSLPVRLAAGTYRVVVAPGHGYWPGPTAPFDVTG